MLNATPWALFSVSDKPYREPLRRGSVRQGEQVQITMATEVAVQVHDTLPQGIENVRALLQK